MFLPLFRFHRDFLYHSVLLSPSIRHTVCLSLIIRAPRGGPQWYHLLAIARPRIPSVSSPLFFPLPLPPGCWSLLHSPPPPTGFFLGYDRSSTVADEEVDRLRINAVNGTEIMVNDNGVHCAIVAPFASRFLFRYTINGLRRRGGPLFDFVSIKFVLCLASQSSTEISRARESLYSRREFLCD